METRDILLKADRIVLALERLEGGKIRALARSWDDAKVISPNQVLEVGHRQAGAAGPGGQAGGLSRHRRHSGLWKRVTVR